MVEQVEDQDLALPDCLALEFLSDMHAPPEFRVAAVGGLNGLLKLRDRDLVHPTRALALVFLGLRRKRDPRAAP